MADADPLRALTTIVTALDAMAVRFALVGGLAVSVRAEPRFTKDVDLAISVDDDAHFERVVRDLRASGFVPAQVLDQVGDGRLATVRLRSRDGMVDLLGRNSGVEAEVVERAERIELPSVGIVPVARVEELLALKLLSVKPERPQDQIDLDNLLDANPSADLDCVRQLLDAITQRGYAREQDLHGKLEELLARRSARRPSG